MRDLPMVPMPYLARVVRTLAARGIPLDRLGIELSPHVLDDLAGQVSLETFADVLRCGADLAGDMGLGLELGLDTKPTSHSWYGLALISAATVRDACELGMRYLRARISPLRVTMFAEGDTAVMQFEETLALGAARMLVVEYFLGGALRIAEFLHGQAFSNSELEFCVDYAEPPHHARFAGRLPRARYGCAKLQARHPVSWLDRTLVLAEPTATREAIGMLERDLQRSDGVDWTVRVRALLADPQHGYPDLDAAAALLGLSGRTLRRYLQADGATYRELRDEARRAAAITMLARSRASIAAVSHTLGYAEPAAFSRAFVRWTGQSPDGFRSQSVAANDTKPVLRTKD